jgi:hypothetical protein
VAFQRGALCMASEGAHTPLDANCMHAGRQAHRSATASLVIASVSDVVNRKNSLPFLVMPLICHVRGDGGRGRSRRMRVGRRSGG